MLQKNCYKSYRKMEKETRSRKRKVELVTLRAQVSRKTQVVTAVSRNGEKCAKFTFFFHNNFIIMENMWKIIK
jgi:hypothetical protein